MRSTIIKIIKKITLGFLILYGYNLLVPARAIIPINIVTVAITTILTIPGLIILIIIKLLIY
ncbi:MAG: pro-sigmaK processing inhibitor BofA family protein [Bacilli bacterium]|nr:pro-sigmaK processing inhibitor BofA family protein [Bacilli bacterium]